MAASQFTIYTSSDTSGPGPLSGTVGCLLTVLDAILVNGYTGKTAAGWSKPFANSGNIGCYKLGAGTGFGMVINDNGPSTPTYQQASASGWEAITGVGSSVGSGTGQFPLPSQLLVTGHVTIRKSVSLDSVSRPWIAFADSRTLYLFISTGDVAGSYFSFYFGDFFSLNGTTDTGRCGINGQTSDASTLNLDPWGMSINVGAGNVVPGAFAARPGGGVGFSTQLGEFGDQSLQGTASMLDGAITGVNPTDNSFYLYPVHLSEGASIRGRLRGVYHFCHTNATATDGQIITGTGDHSGKTFRLVKTTRALSNLLVTAIEISNTVETN